MNKDYLNYLIELLKHDITDEEREHIQFVIAKILLD